MQHRTTSFYVLHLANLAGPSDQLSWPIVSDGRQAYIVGQSAKHW
jgi:hypothetical protein